MIKTKQIENLDLILLAKLDVIKIIDTSLPELVKEIILTDKSIATNLKLELALYTTDLSNRAFIEFNIIHDNTILVFDIINNNYQGSSETDFTINITLNPTNIILQLNNTSLLNYNINCLIYY